MLLNTSRLNTLYSADVSDRTQLHKSLDDLQAQIGPVDGCVTAAGICIDKPFEDHTEEDFHRQLAINVSSTPYVRDHL